MPYTPPSPSPNASYAQSRATSRSSSFSDYPSPPTADVTNPTKPQPTRSTSYLSKHRRSQGGAKSDDDKSFLITPPGVISSGPVLHPPRSTSGSSIRQINHLPMMATGVVISPPDSSQNSSDDETDGRVKRGRQLVNIAELEEAIRKLPQNREASPEADTKSADVLPEPKSPEMLIARIHQKLHHARSASDIVNSKELEKQFRQRQEETQKQQQPSKSSEESSPDIEDDDYRIAPPMVRKKSGELVKSSLKSPSLRRRPSSMPSTPTYPKAVHFDAHLEHVRHFLHAERPSAVSAGSSPVESAVEYENEYPFPHEEPREPPFEWEIALPNFPERMDRSHWIVRVEKVNLSHDKKALLGTAAVANISFHKLVVARFTLDYWQTTSEVVAEYTNDVRRKQREDGYDRFTFKIKLEDMANLEHKTLFFCVRYRVADQEYWDNNSSINYQVDFKKKSVPQNGKAGPLSTAASRPLPRSKPSTTVTARPRSMPIFDDSFDAFDLTTQPEYNSFVASADRTLEMKPIIKPQKKQAGIPDPEALARRANPSGNAFGNRYDFEASLAAAVATATKVLGHEKSGLRRKQPLLKNDKQLPNPYFQNQGLAGLPRSHSSPALAGDFASKSAPPTPQVHIEIPKTEFPSSLDTLKKLGPEGKPSIESTSYRELLDNYCFFGSAKPSPQLVSESAMPSQKNNDTINSDTNGNLTVTNYRVNTGSRSPSPSNLSRSVDGAEGNAAFAGVQTAPQRSSRSPSPSHNMYGFSLGTPYTPSIIQT